MNIDGLSFDTSNGFAKIDSKGNLILTFKPKDSNREADNERLEFHWLKDAPFSFSVFIDEMKRYGILNEDLVWVKYEIRGHHHTQAFHVVGCYEALQAIGCLPELSWPQVRNLFNATFKTRINNSKVLQNKAGKQSKGRFLESDYFHAIFSSIPANPQEPLK